MNAEEPMVTEGNVRQAPLAETERIEAIDVLRGFALLGILLPWTWIHDRMRWHLTLLRYFRILRKQLHHIRCPVLLMHAHDDYLVRVKSSVTIHVGVSSRDRKLIVLDEGGHLLPWGPAYQRVWREIEGWVARVGGELREAAPPSG